MRSRRILFDRFSFPRMRGLHYLLDEKKPITDYLFVGDRRERFSMYFENGFPLFTVPKDSDRSYCLFELRRPSRTIRIFCPEKHKNLDAVVWYFSVEIQDPSGETHVLPGQIRVNPNDPSIRMMRGKPRFVEVLERVELNESLA